MSIERRLNKVKRTREEILELFKFLEKLCKLCYGKGYGTSMYGSEASSDLPDMEPIKRSEVMPMRSRIVFCDCERGKTLKADIERNYTPIP